ncbi:MotA/TolQ/ExbB proton channel family protein [Desulfobaculum sp. SPO524]|uniref:MotA/TolQ/ExbB proton channel family protein n=1 Tax=Desulfobaculum sp. SPO524 TaxID=3378071 RepID=UPI00385319D6
MTYLEQGGVMLWPIIILSVLALAVIIERLILFSTSRFPGDDTVQDITATAANGNTDSALHSAEEAAPAYAPLFRSILTNSGREQREAAATRAGEGILFTLGRRLDFLATTASAAPLLGLLGTVLGMIDAFSRLSSAGNAVDITTLAGGIWQALLTTAAGLAVAIPALLAHAWFRRQQEKAAFAMQRTANTLIDAMERRDG